MDTKIPQKQKIEGSQKARRTAARLAAVQGAYQILAAGQTARTVIDDFRENPPGDRAGGGEKMVTPDLPLMSAIIGGVEERRQDVEQLVAGAQNRRAGTGDTPAYAPPEPLLQAVLMCGAYELLAHHDTDVPIIISDYLDVTHAFFDQGESKLVNAVLDRIAKNVRDMA